MEKPATTGRRAEGSGLDYGGDVDWDPDEVIMGTVVVLVTLAVLAGVAIALGAAVHYGWL